MGLGPDIWGPSGWKFIHFITLGYPKNPTSDNKNNYKSFLTMISDILPCSLCSNHYKENLIKYPLTDDILSNKIKLFNWSVDMHNEVNKINKKPIVSYDEALDLFYNKFNKSNSNNDDNYNNDTNYNNYNKKNYNKKNYDNYNKKNYKKKDYTNYILLFIVIILIIFYLYYIMKKV